MTSLEQQTITIPVRMRARVAAKELGVGMNVLYRLANEGLIEFYLIGNRYEFTREGIAKFLESARQPRVAA